MKLEEMIMVIKKEKGKEVNYISNLNDYMKTLEEIYPGALQDRADAIAALYETKQGRIGWIEEPGFSGSVYHVRFCNDSSELKKFLQGDFNNKSSEAVGLDTELCSPCYKDVLLAYGLDERGHSTFSFHYERLVHGFGEGEVLTNLNGEKYRVLEKLSTKDLLLMSETTREVLIAKDVGYYQRTPNVEYDSVDSEIYGIEWQHGDYLGNHISAINFEKIREDYAESQQKEIQQKNVKLKKVAKKQQVEIKGTKL